MFEVETTPIEGCYIITPKVFKDQRGHFLVPYNKDELNKIVGTPIDFIQDNQSFSRFGVIRGLHFQRPPYSQTKLVSCLSGHVIDVIVDLRRDSSTYGKHITIDLIAEEHKMVLVPNWCAHGFSTVSDTAIFSYKVDKRYNKDSEECIRFDDPDLGIDWGVPKYIQTLSEKDKSGKFLKDLKF